MKKIATFVYTRTLLKKHKWIKVSTFSFNFQRTYVKQSKENMLQNNIYTKPVKQRKGYQISILTFFVCPRGSPCGWNSFSFSYF